MLEAKSQKKQSSHLSPFYLHILLVFVSSRHSTQDKMPLTSNTVATVLCAVLLLGFSRSSHQYTYSCDSNAPCGCSSSPASVSRIVGGETAETNTWSWAVSISIGGSSLCGGAVLSSSWIITAAHCVPSVSPSQVIVYAGSNTRFSGQSRVASRVIVHPSYVSGTFENDIALIQLSTPLTMTSAVKPICLPSISSATLAAGEWPPAGYYVCYIISVFLFEINNKHLLLGCGCWMGHTL